MEIIVTVLPNAPAILHNDAQVFSDNADSNNANDYATVATNVAAEADLAVVKVDNPDPVAAGYEMTYAVTISNNGPSTAHDVKLEDTLPDEVIFIGTTISSGSGTCVLVNVPPYTVFCDLGDLDPGDFMTVYIQVLVDPEVPEGATFDNTAEVSSSSADGDLSNNIASTTTTVSGVADLEIIKEGTYDLSNPSYTIEYIITVNNHGPSDATDVIVLDTLPVTPKKMVYVFDTGNGACIYDETSHTITCDFGTLPAGETIVVKFYFDARGSLGVITNVVEVSTSVFDPDMENNTDRKDLYIHG
jgi:uncharacterized repeat protein (TIGR01451 family)